MRYSPFLLCKLGAREPNARYLVVNNIVEINQILSEDIEYVTDVFRFVTHRTRQVPSSEPKGLFDLAPGCGCE